MNTNQTGPAGRPKVHMGTLVALYAGHEPAKPGERPEWSGTLEEFHRDNREGEAARWLREIIGALAEGRDVPLGGGAVVAVTLRLAPEAKGAEITPAGPAALAAAEAEARPSVGDRPEYPGEAELAQAWAGLAAHIQAIAYGTGHDAARGA